MLVFFKESPLERFPALRTLQDGGSAGGVLAVWTFHSSPRYVDPNPFIIIIAQLGMECNHGFTTPVCQNRTAKARFKSAKNCHVIKKVTVTSKVTVT
jgi:hypothetical protein